MPGQAPTRAMLSRLVRGIGLVFVVGLVLTGPADATFLTPNDAFYWNLPPASGNPYDQEGAIAASPDGNLVYVADKYANQVEQFTSDGALKRVWRSRSFRGPTGVSTDLSG